tara:strand:- start:1520 stop:1864 length:345 start_codon:yes stop_codon:yes gene_type:complete
MKMNHKLETSEDVLDKLFTVICSRRENETKGSYTSTLFEGGQQLIARKVGEEAIECVVAGLSGTKKEIISESSDLLFHLMVLWSNSGILPKDVWEELTRRQGISGLVEKKSRSS